MNQRTTTGLIVGAAALGLLLTGCSDPGSNATAGTVSKQGFNLTPEQNRQAAEPVAAATKIVPASVKEDGKLTVAIAPGSAPLAMFATDNKTVIGDEADIAVALAQSLGLEADLVPVSWADWPLGLESGKYEAVISNVTVTQARKQKYDFATYREDKLGFYVQADSKIKEIRAPKDVAGLRITVGSGTNQEKILLSWDAQNKKAGLKPVSFQYYDEDALASVALTSGRADASFGPNASGAYKANTDGKTRLVGLVPGGWPDAASIAVTVKKDSGLAEASQAGVNGLIESGLYKQILDKWALGEEAIPTSELNPPGLKD
ncbi:ABC transporter substrate-binding protein [Paeniglutamicibacter kerguelensis]|uniref:Polar amino acid transport system substrate-binding protein n=1 Tax=Paeniglutamicibacter kerguelensis TaxID=254788 RepID=A0ABS4XFH7_9MICC|nr:ABC transporter substrate-binding protein [Paeniglutamicibacter kerguelensis]MBP2387212.1 polar amino acid transport system substrate-binding protein [Paeniglutamicibacter kerguelensis]